MNAFNPYSDVGPVWSPTRGELAFQGSRTDASPISIYLVGSDGRGERRLAVGQNPSWSPDGQRLAFIDNYKLITIDRNGKGRPQVSRKGAAWSPKGGLLGYVAGTKADRGGGLPTKQRVETVSADGKRVHVLVREPPRVARLGRACLDTARQADSRRGRGSLIRPPGARWLVAGAKSQG